MFDKLLLKNIVPRSRVLMALIGLLISSTILSGTISLILGVYSGSMNYLGETDDIIILSNEKASTPFSSTIPYELMTLAATLHGVVKASPEVLSTVITRGQSIYLRGIDQSVFWEFDDYKSINGRFWLKESLNEVVIGHRLAKKAKVSVGESIMVYSTQKPSSMNLKVVGILDTDTLLADELIAPLWVAQFLAFQNEAVLSHARLKIDLDQVSKNEIRNQIKNNYNLEVNFNPLNGSETDISGVINVETLGGLIIESESFTDLTQEFSFFLPFRYYVISVISHSEIIGSESIPLTEDLYQTIDIGKKAYELVFNVSAGGQPAAGAKIVIESPVLTDDILIETNSIGFAQISLTENYYSVEVNYFDLTWTSDFHQNSTRFIPVTLPEVLPSFDIYSPLNGSFYYTSPVRLNLSDSPKQFYYSLDGSEFISFTSGHNLYPSAGKHELVIKATNNGLNFTEKTVFFALGLKSVEVDCFWSNMSTAPRVHMGTLVEVSYTPSDAIVRYQWTHEETIYNSTTFNGSFFVSTPIIPGQYYLLVTLHHVFEDGIYRLLTKRLGIYVTFIPNILGISVANNSIIYSDQRISFWASQYNGTFSYAWDADPLKSITNESIITPRGFFGERTLSLQTFLDENIFSITYTLNISEGGFPFFDLSFDPQNNVTSATWQSLEFTQSRPSYVLIDWGFGKIMLNESFSFMIPPTEGNYSLSIIINDIYNIDHTYTFQIITQQNYQVPFVFLEGRTLGVIPTPYLSINVIGQFDEANVSLYHSNDSLISAFNYDDLIRWYLLPGDYYWVLISIQESAFSINKGIFSIANFANNKTYTSFDPWESDASIAIPHLFQINTIFKPNVTYVNGLFSLPSGLSIIRYYALNTSSGLIVVFQDYVYVKLQVDYFLPENWCSLSLNETLEIIFAPSYSEVHDILFEIRYENGTIIIPERNYRSSKNVSLSPGIYRLSYKFLDILGNSFNNSLRFVHLPELFDVSFDIYNASTGEEYSLYFLDIYSVTYHIWIHYNLTDSYDVKLPEGLYRVDLEYELDNVYRFTIEISSNFYYLIPIGLCNLTLSFEEPINHFPVEGVHLTIRHLESQTIHSTYYISSSSSSFNLPAGNYSIEVLSDYNQKGTIEIMLITKRVEIITLSPVFHTSDLELKWLNGSYVKNPEISVTSPYYSESIIVSLLAGKSSISLPLGPLIFEINVSTFNFFRSIILTSEMTSIELFLPSSSVNDPQYSPGFDSSKLSSFDISVSNSGEYFSSYLEGPLALTSTLLISLVLIVSLVIFVNIHSIFNNIIDETEQELWILHALGSSQSQMVLNFGTRMLFISLFSSIFGFFSGVSLIALFTRVGETRVLGHVFYPVLSPTVFLSNLGIIVIITIISCTYSIIRKKHSFIMETILDK
jgi:ABC-type lipoprotein release transport system permease subunit